MNESFRLNTALSKITQSIVLVYQGIAVLIFVGALLLGYEWMRNPFIGGIFEQTMVLNGSDTSQTGKHWALYEAGFKIGDQLVSVNGQSVSSGRDLDRILSSLAVGQTVPVVLRMPEGEERSADITLQSFPFSDRIAYFVVPILLSLVFLGSSLWIFGLRRTEAAGRSFSMMATSVAIVTGALFDLYSYHYFTYLWTLAAALCGGALIDLGLAFPQEAPFLFRRPYWRWFGYAIGIGLAINAYIVLYDFDHPTAYFVAWRNIYIFVGLSALFYFGAMAFRAYFSYSPVVKSQARTILFGALLAFGPIVFWLLYSSFQTAMQWTVDSI